MTRYTAIIIDDEPLAIDVLRHHFKQCKEWNILASFTNAVDALAYLKDHHVDLVFTDIAMPTISGTTLVKLAPAHNHFVMTTSYSEYAIECFELNVVDYLLKPISLDRFRKSLERYTANRAAMETSTSQAPAFFYIKEGDEFVKVQIEDIDYIEGMKDYAKIVCGKNYYLALKTLKSIVESLERFHFIRVHKSYIVPLAKINQYNSKSLLIGAHEIPIGNSYRQEIKEYLEQNKF